MDRPNKIALAGALGFLALAFGALGGGLLNAGAATNTTQQTAPPIGETAPGFRHVDDGDAPGRAGHRGDCPDHADRAGDTGGSSGSTDL